MNKCNNKNKQISITYYGGLLGLMISKALLKMLLFDLAFDFVGRQEVMFLESTHFNIFSTTALTIGCFVFNVI